MSRMPSDDRISAYADGQLSEEERNEVDALLESSDEARQELADYQKLSHLLKALPQEQATDDLSRRVLAQAEQESLLGSRVEMASGEATTSASSSRRGLILTTIATGAVLLLAISLVSEFSQSERGMARQEASTEESLAFSDSANGLVADVDFTAEPSESEALGVSSAMMGSSEVPDRFSMELGDQGLMKLANPHNLKTAAIGDTLEGWKFEDDRIVVVQLTVVDREQVLNSMHVLLSDLSIPSEPSRDGKGSKEGNGFYAVYVEADQDKLTAALKELQEDMNIEEMYVSAELPSSGLNPYFAEQGYAMVDGLVEEEREGSSKPASEPTTSELKLETAPTPKESAEKPSRQLSDRIENTPKQRAVASIPPPPPLPESNPAPSLPAIERSFAYSTRQVQLRLPESVGNQMLAQPGVAGQPSISNGFASGRSVNEEALSEFQKDKNAKPLEAPIGSLAGMREKSRFARNQSARPVQILFLLTPEPKPAAPVP